MSDGTLTDTDRKALTHWVFTFTEAKVISDPDFRAVEQIVRAHVEQERADIRAKVEALPPANDTGQSYILRDDVLALLDGGRDA